MRVEGHAVYAGGGFNGTNVPLPTAPRPNGQRRERGPVIVLQPLTTAQERALERRSEKQAQRPSRARNPRTDLVTPDEARRLAEAYTDGASLIDLKRDTGRDLKTIKAHLIRQGVTLRQQRATPKRRDARFLTAEQSQAIADAYQAGASIGQIQARMGHSVECIRRHVKLHGVPMRRTGAPAVVLTDAERTLILAAYERYGVTAKVARVLHRDVRIVREVLDEAGVDRIRGKHQPLSDEERARIWELAATGMPQRAIAKTIGRGHTAVGEVLRGKK